MLPRFSVTSRLPSGRNVIAHGSLNSATGSAEMAVPLSLSTVNDWAPTGIEKPASAVANARTCVTRMEILRTKLLWRWDYR
jgi:hypothetical protein